MSQKAQLWKELKSPAEEFTPIPFWFFNDEPDEDRMRNQLMDYVEKGVNGIVLHPRIGVPKEVSYLSESYFQAVRFLVKTADKLHMKIVLYDEGMYPSGSAHGMVVLKNPDFASKGVKLVTEAELKCMREQDVSVQAMKEAGTPKFPEVITQFSDGKYLVYTFTGGTIRGIHFGEDDGEAGAPASADILNPEAVDEFIRLTHDRYYEELKEYFGTTIIAFFTDEPSALGRNAIGFREWLPGLEKELLEAGGKLEELEALFSNEHNATTEIYHKLIKKHLREIFYRKLSEWCENHGIALMGHPEVSDDVEEELYFHIPGQDLILRRVSPETGGLTEFDSVQAKLPADIARHLGRRRNANECFGVCFRNKIPWYFKAEDMKWYLDWLGIRGVNLFVPHAFYYSVTGARKEERPPDVGPNNIWWPHYRRFSDYMKRLSFLMTDSVNGAKVAVLCHNNQVPYKELAVLFENQVEFNYLPLALLPECKVENSRLCIKDYQYEAVLNVGNKAWDESLLNVSGDGSNVQLFHDAETIINSCMQEADKKACHGNNYAAVHTGKPCRNLRVSALQKLSTKMYLFSNEGQEALETEVTVPGKGTPILVDLWRGEAGVVTCGQAAEQSLADVTAKTDVQTEAGIRLTISLQPRETALVIMDEDDSLAETLKPVKEEKYLGDMTAQFTLLEKKDNRAVYTMEYHADSVMGTETIGVVAEEMVECYCNGELADVAFWSPYRLRVGQLLKEGKNELKLVVTGNAANIYCEAELPYGLL